MRFALLLLATLLVALGGVYVAFGRGSDELAGIAPPQPATESGRAHHFDVEKITGGLNRPTWVGAAPGDDALWVVEQPGRVLRIAGGRRTTVLDMSSGVKLGAEQGLLGIAFDPDFAKDRRLYLHWSDLNGD